MKKEWYVYHSQEACSVVRQYATIGYRYECTGDVDEMGAYLRVSNNIVLFFRAEYIKKVRQNVREMI